MDIVPADSALFCDPGFNFELRKLIKMQIGTICRGETTQKFAILPDLLFPKRFLMYIKNILLKN
jgi:hypothetical protein